MIHFKIKEEGTTVGTTLKEKDKIRIERNFKEKTVAISFWRKETKLACDKKQLEVYEKDFSTKKLGSFLEEVKAFRKKVMNFSEIKIDHHHGLENLNGTYIVTLTIRKV